MTNEYLITSAMIDFGGEFVKRLAMAYRAADPENQDKIKAAWPEYWEKYRAIAAMKEIELCHDTQVFRELIKEKDRLLEGIKYWSYCMAIGMERECPEKVNELGDFLRSCEVTPYSSRSLYERR